MASTRVTFDNLRGQSLVGYLERPDAGEPIGAAIFAHCFTCAPDLRAAAGIARFLAGQGFVTLRFDFTGLGQSSADFEGTTFKTNLDDLLAAANWMHNEGHEVTLLVGHSLGGTACLAAANGIRSAKAVATLGAPFDLEASALFISAATEIEQTGVAEIRLDGRKFKITQELARDLAGARIRECAANLGRPLLVLHGLGDDTVELAQANALFDGAAQPKSFVGLDGADHLLSSDRDHGFVGEVIATWSRRYL